MKNLFLLAVAVLFLGLTNVIYANGVTGQNLQDGLVAWYKFDGNANDLSGNNYHLTNVGAAKLVTGHKGDADGAYEFNGTSTSKLSADPAVVVRGDFSYSLWFQTSELMSSHGSSRTAWNPGNDIIHSGFKDYEYVGAGLRVGTDGLAVVEHGGMYRSTVFQYKKNIGASWHHVVVVVAAGRGEVVYLDGEYVGEAEINSSTLTSSHGNGVKAIHLDSDGVGGGQWGYYTGKIDDLRIYNRVLSATEVKALYDGEGVPKTWYVNGTSGSDSYSGESPTQAKKTIQAAVDAAAEGDTILVAPGTYAPIVTCNKLLSIRSQQGAWVTVIDGGNEMACVDAFNVGYVGCGGSETWIGTNTSVVGFTLQNGICGIRGGMVAKCFIRRNSGSGVAHSVADNCLIYENSGGNGGGCIGSLARNCTIVNNHASMVGDGTYCCVLLNCIVAGNGDCGDDVFGLGDAYCSASEPLLNRTLGYSSFVKENVFSVISFLSRQQLERLLGLSEM